MLQFIIALMNERPSSSTDRVLYSTEFINPAELAVRLLLIRKDLAVQVILSVRPLFNMHLLVVVLG